MTVRILLLPLRSTPLRFQRGGFKNLSLRISNGRKEFDPSECSGRLTFLAPNSSGSGKFRFLIPTRICAAVFGRSEENALSERRGTRCHFVNHPNAGAPSCPRSKTNHT